MNQDPRAAVPEALARLADAGIAACVWKSLDRWSDSVQGLTDLDLLVDPARIDDACEVLQSQGWILLHAEAWRRYPGLHDLVRFDPRVGRWVHIHLHAGLVMGEKLLKSLRPQWTSLYLRRSTISQGVPHAEAELEFVVFILRLCLKLTWIDHARVVRRRSRRALYRDLRGEYDELRERCSRERIEAVLGEAEFASIDPRIVLDAFDDLDSLDRARRARLRRALREHRDGSGAGRRVRALYRSWLRRVQGVGKRLPGAGISIAICGPDGSGKTTLVDALCSDLAAHFEVSRVYMGGNLASAGPWRRLVHLPVIPVYLVTRKVLKILSASAAVAAVERFCFGLDDLLLALEKRGRARHAERQRRAGALVVYERFPLFPGAGDAGLPDTLPVFRRRVRAVYDALRTPDVLCVLEVDLDTVRARRPADDARVGEEKIRAFGEFIRGGATGDTFQVIDASAAPEAIRAQVNLLVQDCLARAARNRASTLPPAGAGAAT